MSRAFVPACPMPHRAPWKPAVGLTACHCYGRTIPHGHARAEVVRQQDGNGLGFGSSVKVEWRVVATATGAPIQLTPESASNARLPSGPGVLFLSLLAYASGAGK